MKEIYEVASMFLPNEAIVNCSILGNGHINTTYLVTTENCKYVLQKINTSIFKDVDALMSNIQGVTHFIRNKHRNDGRSYENRTLHFIPSPDKKRYLSHNGNAYRMYIYIDNVFTVDKMERVENFYSAGLGFGEFANILSDFDASQLHETIKNFHNTPSRYNDFENAVKANLSGRLNEVLPEVEFIRARKDFTSLFVDKLSNGTLPLRVTHNDTKINNILFDNKTGKPVAVIDLDTVMPGSYLYDFGDAIRSGATYAAEDERDLSIVIFDLELYEAFTKGYLTMCGKSLTPMEIEMLPYASIMLTLECGMRFLTDHLNGDTYFRISREGHNLDRARTQFTLVQQMENNIDKMKEIINKYL